MAVSSLKVSDEMVFVVKDQMVDKVLKEVEMRHGRGRMRHMSTSGR